MERRQTYIPPPMAGIRADLGADQLGPTMLRAARNLLARGGRVRTRPGLTLRSWATAPADRAMGATQYDVGAVEGMVVVGTTVGWWAFNPSTNTWADVTDPAGKLTGGGDSLVTFKVMEVGGTDYLLGVNCTNTPKAWSGTGTYRTVLNLPPSQLTAPVGIAVAANRVMMMQGHKVYVSADGDFDDGWSNHIANLNQTPGTGVCLMEMGPYAVAVYKTDAIYLAQALSGLVPFRYDLQAVGVPGPVGPKAVVPLPDGSHAFLARNGEVYRFDGTRCTPLAPQGNVRACVASILSSDRMWRCHGFYEPDTHLLWFVFPRSGSADPYGAVVIDLGGGGDEATMFPVWEQVWPAHAITAAIPLLLKRSKLLGELPGLLTEYAGMKLKDFVQWSQTTWMLGTAGEVYDLAGNSDDGTAIRAWAVWGGQAFDHGGYKTLQQLEMATACADTVLTGTVGVGLKELGDNVIESLAYTVAMGGTARKLVPVRRSARLFELRLDVTTGTPFYVDGVLVTHVPRGWR